MLALLLIASLAAACTPQQDSQSPSQSTSGPAPRAGGHSGPLLQDIPHPIGVKWDWSRVNRFAPYLRNLSGGATFYIVVWCDVERQQGRRDWSQVDEVARSTSALGQSLLLKIRTGSCWATGGQRGRLRGAQRKTASAMPLDLGAYQGFVREVVRRYSAQNVHEYAIENEPNARKFFWDGTAQEYERLVTLGASAIRSVDPRARVLDGGLASSVYGVGIAQHLLFKGQEAAAVAAYQRYYARRFVARPDDLPQVTNAGELRSALNGEQARRNLEMITATLRLVKNKVVDAYQLHFYESWETVPALLAYLHDVLPPSFPIEAWEVGMFWRDGPADQQVRAGEVIKSVVNLLAGGVRRVIWLPLAYNADSSTGRGEIRYGLLDPDGRVRLAGKALHKVAAAAQGASWRAVSTSTLTGIAFGRRNKSTLLLWSDRGATLPAPKQPGIQAEGIDGTQLPWASAGLRLTPQPVLISVDAEVKDALRITE